jgi:hypothetical protein
MRLREGEERRSAMWTILDENSTPIVWEERTRPGGVSTDFGGENGVRCTFRFYEAVEKA